MKLRWRKPHSLFVVALFLLWTVQPGFAQEPGTTDNERRPSLGGPNTVANQLESDRADRDVLYEFRFLKPYFDWQARLKEQYGFSFGLDYSAVYLKANSSLPETDDAASSGVVRLYSSWDLLGRGTENTGQLVFKGKHRHSYTDTPPNGFSLNSLGNVGVLAATYSDQEFRLTNLYWQHRWNTGRVVGLIGFLDVTDFMDIFALASPWLHFTNFAFNIGAATISMPDDATLGLAAAVWLNDN